MKYSCLLFLASCAAADASDVPPPFTGQLKYIAEVSYSADPVLESALPKAERMLDRMGFVFYETEAPPQIPIWSRPDQKCADNPRWLGYYSYNETAPYIMICNRTQAADYPGILAHEMAHAVGVEHISDKVGIALMNPAPIVRYFTDLDAIAFEHGRVFEGSIFDHGQSRTQQTDQ